MSTYLDNAATSFPKPEAVYGAVTDVMRHTGASPGRGGYGLSLEASRIMMDTRDKVADLINAPDPERVIFTANATAALNLAVQGVLLPGDHVITTVMEHNSLLRPLRHMEKAGVKLTVLPAGTDGIIDPDSIRKAVTAQTRMIALAHVSNVTGGIQPIAAAADAARNCGAFFLLDAAQSAGVLRLDMQADGIDMLAAPGHKGIMGPQGTGFLAISKAVSLRPLIMGGTGTSSDQELQPEIYPDGFEAGTHNLPGIAGLGAAIEFLQQTGVEIIGQHEKLLAELIREKLADIPGIELFGPADPALRTGLVSFNCNGLDATELAFMLDRYHDFAVRAGLHCAPLAHRAIGSYPVGTVRVSPGWFNTTEEAEAFCKAIKDITRKGKP